LKVFESQSEVTRSVVGLGQGTGCCGIALRRLATSSNSLYEHQEVIFVLQHHKVFLIQYGLVQMAFKRHKGLNHMGWLKELTRHLKT
jgi:hypothetical protein